jgi:hypothetical protein
MTDDTDPARTEGKSPDRPASSEDTENDETDRSPRSERTDQDHLRGVEDGCGCAEVWEHLSEQRERNRAEREAGPEEDVAPATGEG